MSEEDQEQKTEQPSSKRLEDAFKRGQVPFSREVTSFLMIFALAMLVGAMLPQMMRMAYTALAPFILAPDQMSADASGLGKRLQGLLADGLLILLLPFAATICSALAGSVLQNGLVFSAESLKPKWSKISPIKGLGKIFSKRSLVEFFKGLLKLMIVGVFCWKAVESYLPELKQLPSRDTLALLIFLSKVALKLVIWVCIAMFFIALADLLYQRWEHIRSLRMTKQEVRDEYKQQEGDPHIKQRLRQIRMEKAKKRMMAAVPGADVVITNPTHYSVALKYDNTAMAAPKVVAKGIDHIALTIRKVAKEHNIVIMENPPLARALYASVEIDDEIPLEHYKAVAEIISYVYKVKGRKAPAQNRSSGSATKRP